MIYTLTDNSVTVLGNDFKPKTMPCTHPAFDQVVRALKAGNDNEVQTLMDLPNAISSFTQGKVQVVDRQLFYDGKPLHNGLATRILQFIGAGDPEHAKPLANFLEKVKQNPSRRAAEGLYDWAAKSNLPITAEGDIIAWKVVNGDYTSIYNSAQKFDNSVGKVVEVERNEVDEDPDRTCSHGLHFCSTEYLPHYYGFQPGYRIVVLKIHPADVVAFPRDYNVSKGRAFRYEVIGEVPQDKVRDFFPSPVTNWSEVRTGNTDPEGDLDEELEIDRYYRARNGDIFYVQAYDPDGDEYPFTADNVETGETETFARYGSYNVYDAHDLDLVELLPEDFDPDAEPAKAEEEDFRPTSFLAAIFSPFFRS